MRDESEWSFVQMVMLEWCEGSQSASVRVDALPVVGFFFNMAQWRLHASVACRLAAVVTDCILLLRCARVATILR